MKNPRSFVYFTAVGGACLAIALCSTSGMAQQPRKPPGRPASPATPTPTPKPTPVIIPAAAPSEEMNELSPPNDASDDAPVTETIIDATDGATFASKERIATFAGHVRVTDPRFQLACDRLTVFLNKSTPTDAAAGTTPPPPAVTPAPAKGGNTPPPDAQAQASSGNGGIDHAVAEGHVIILQKRAPAKPGDEEKISIGRGEKGTFDNKSGDMVLYGMPEIEQNGNSHVATSPDTVMTIHKDSSLDTKGPNKTILIQHKGNGGGTFELPGVPASPAGNASSKPKKNGNGAPAQAATPASH